MKLLAIDTSTRATVLGLSMDGQIVDRTTAAVQTHSRDILPDIQQLLEDSSLVLTDLDGIVFGQGPGSFTGLRIATGVVQGLAYGAELPVVPVSSMQVIAQSVVSSKPRGEHDHVMVAITARLEEIYYGAYQIVDELAVAVIDEGVLDVSELPLLPDANWTGAGNAWTLQSKIEASTGQKFDSILDQDTPRLEDLLKLGQVALAGGRAVNALEARPVYLREEVATRPGKG